MYSHQPVCPPLGRTHSITPNSLVGLECNKHKQTVLHLESSWAPAGLAPLLPVPWTSSLGQPCLCSTAPRSRRAAGRTMRWCWPQSASHLDAVEKPAGCWRWGTGRSWHWETSKSPPQPCWWSFWCSGTHHPERLGQEGRRCYNNVSILIHTKCFHQLM